MLKLIKYFFVAMFFLMIGLYLGFRVGSEKIWINSQTSIASGLHFELEKWKHPPEEDMRVIAYENTMRRYIRETIVDYGKYQSSWVSKIDLGIGWDESSQNTMQLMVDWYIKQKEIDFSSITFEEYWKIIEANDPTMYAEVKVSDPALYEEMREESSLYLQSIKGAIRASHGL